MGTATGRLEAKMTEADAFGEAFEKRMQAVQDARLRQEARHANALLELLDRRPELREVIPLADVAGDRTLWCA
jgi:hypothetical protein